MDDLLSEFLTETNESLQVLDTEIVTLEQNPNNPDLLHNIFRVMHTIKGTCGFLGLPRLEAVAHSGETVLGKVRDGELEVNQDRVSLVLECLDRIRDIVGALEERGEEPEGDDAELLNRLNAVIEKADADAAGGGEAAGDSGGEGEADSGAGEAEDDMAAAMAAMEAEGTDEGEAAPAGGEVVAESAPADAASPDRADPADDGEAAGPPAPAPQTQPATTSESQPPAAGGDQGGGNQGSGQGGSGAGAGGGGKGDGGRQGGGSGPQSIRVSVDLLESLMTTVSELVLNRNQLLQILRQYNESEFAAPLQRLNHVVSELQEGVMKTRMQPIDNAWSKLPRIVRDLSADLGKKIELKKKGEETELDRQVLDLIKDPLTHMVRNSCDHGLERPEERREAGKAEVGTIALNAYHEGGHIIIEIADDGRGLDPEKIKDKAIRNGLTTEAECTNLTEQQILQFIFKPGFSTAAAVTSVSGRGVGMDVVRNNIEEIGGTIELSSKLGMGSKFTVKIPLTLAIASALIVECGGERFAIPQLSVKELVRAKGDSEKSIERIKDTPVLRLRDRLLPLINLRQLLRLDGEGDQPQLERQGAQNAATQSGDAENEERDGFIVVSQVGTYHFGIIVDQVYDTEEIVVKPVARILRNIPLFSGNTILGDGRVVMILDPNGIAQASGEITVSEGQDMGEDERSVSEDEAVSMLIFRAVDDAPKAVPLGLVSRLEEIDLESVEISNGQRVIQYRGKLMPLILMDGAKGLESQGKQPVLVFTDQNRSMGLVVDEIVDIVQEAMNIELSGERAGFLGSAVIAGKATDVIDTGHYLTKAYPDWFRGEERRGRSRRGYGRRVLFVDDSPFFRNMLVPVLDTAGYDVTSAESAERALELHNDGHTFDVIISDIEMSGMSGYEFAEHVQKQTSWASTPMIALSSYADPQDMERGRAAGFRDYVAKFDRETLLDTLREILNEEKLPERGAA